MKTVTINVGSSEGLHQRPSAVVVEIARLFSSELVLTSEHNGISIDAKSIMQITMMACTFGTKLKIFGNGPDEDLAVEVLSVLLQKKFNLARLFGDNELDGMIRQKAVQKILHYLKQYPESEK